MKPSRYFLVTLIKSIGEEKLNGIWVNNNFNKFGEIQSFKPYTTEKEVLITFKNFVVIKQNTLRSENIEVSIQYCTRGFIQSNLIFNAQVDEILSELKSTTAVDCFKQGHNRFLLTFAGDCPENVRFTNGYTFRVDPERNRGPDRFMSYNSNDTATRKNDSHRNSFSDPVKERASTNKNPTPERTATRMNDHQSNSSFDPVKERASTSEIPSPENDVDLQSSIAIDIDQMIDKLKSFKKRILTSSSSSSSKRPRKE